MFAKSLICSAIASLASAQIDLEFTSQNKFKLNDAAFVNMGKFEDSEDFMLISTFKAIGNGHIYIVPGVKEAVESGDVSSLDPVKLDTSSFEWPNNIEVVPQDVFGERAILVPDGFLVPGHKNGGLHIVRMDESDITKTTETVKITEKVRNYDWFYHKGVWLDLNGDGRKDLLTARSNAKKGDGELLWLEQPEGGLDSGEYWTEHILCNCADVNFDVVELPEYKYEVVVFTAHFFDEALRVQRVSTVDGSLIESKTIDDENILSAYNVAVVDLNSDGNKQLLVNNHETKDKKTGIWAYEFPNDIMNDEWTRQTIASDFHNAFSLTVPNMSPGYTYAIYPNGYHKNERAHILVAGDGDHKAHALYPSGDSSVFEYTDTVFSDAKGTVGAMTFSDLDEDGWQEVWVANYDKGYVELFELSDASSSVE